MSSRKNSVCPSILALLAGVFRMRFSPSLSESEDCRSSESEASLSLDPRVQSATSKSSSSSCPPSIVFSFFLFPPWAQRHSIRTPLQFNTPLWLAHISLIIPLKNLRDRFRADSYSVGFFKPKFHSFPTFRKHVLNAKWNYSHLLSRWFS